MDQYVDVFIYIGEAIRCLRKIPLFYSLSCVSSIHCLLSYILVFYVHILRTRYSNAIDSHLLSEKKALSRGRDVSHIWA